MPRWPANICRCATYVRIRAAIHQAAQTWQPARPPPLKRSAPCTSPYRSRRSVRRGGCAFRADPPSVPAAHHPCRLGLTLGILMPGCGTAPAAPDAARALHLSLWRCRFCASHRQHRYRDLQTPGGRPGRLDRASGHRRRGAGCVLGADARRERAGEGAALRQPGTRSEGRRAAHRGLDSVANSWQQLRQAGATARAMLVAAAAKHGVCRRVRSR